MTLPVTVEIAFGVDPFDSTTLNTGSNWTDVTSYVRSADYSTSTRSDRFGVFAAGYASIVLNDLDREMDPSFSGSTYAGQFKTRVPVRIVGTHSSTDYVQWYGYASLWTPQYIGKDAVTRLDAIDGLGALSRFTMVEVTSDVGLSDTIATRIGRVLDAWGFPSGYRDLDTGTTLAATRWGVNALQHCQVAAMTDGGVFYADRDGTLTFDGLTALASTRQTTSQATLTSGILTEPGPVRSGVGQTFRNLVTIGGAAVTTAEVDNVGANEMPVAFTRTDLFMDTDDKAAALADFYADLYGTETPYTVQASYTAATASASSHFTSIFQRRIRDRVTVELTVPGGGATISDDLFIEGVNGRISNGRWDITHTYSPAEIYDDNLTAPPSQWLILNDTPNGKLDTYRLAY